jgi:KaiC/GvpD/RAD55 family RecA-like ATPase
MERVSTGIAELDTKLSGGYPKGKGLLITGVSGAGKTIFGLHLLYSSHSACRSSNIILFAFFPHQAQNIP